MDVRICWSAVAKVMVGVAGFEPTTSPTPRVCASQTALYSAKVAIIRRLGVAYEA